MKLGLIGAGRITPFHIDAAIEVGFKPTAIVGTPGSIRARNLQKEYSIPNCLNGLDELERIELDAVLVAVTPKSTIEVLKGISSLKLPTLVEKPVAPDHHTLQVFSGSYDCSRIMVGYNRRFYSSVFALKSELRPEYPKYFSLLISESSSSLNPNFQVKKELVMSNSVHGFDLLNYFFGKPNKVIALGNSLDSEVISAYFEFDSLATGICQISFNMPETARFTVYQNRVKFQLSPIEKFAKYTSIQSSSLNREFPNRDYKLESAFDWKPNKRDIDFKAGFIRQMEEFRSFIVTGKSFIGADIESAKLALKVGQEIFRDSTNAKLNGEE